MFTKFLITAAKIDFSMLGGKTSKLDAYLPMQKNPVRIHSLRYVDIMCDFSKIGLKTTYFSNVDFSGNIDSKAFIKVFFAFSKSTVESASLRHTIFFLRFRIKLDICSRLLF